MRERNVSQRLLFYIQKQMSDNEKKLKIIILKIITDSRIRSIICKGPKYRFPVPIDFKSCREVIAGALQEFCNRWCKREHVESNALNSWKLNIFKIIDGRISFYCNNLDLLPPKPKFTFRHLKKGIQEFHRKFVLAPADKAANNVVVVWKRYYINTLKQELSTAKTYEHSRLDGTSIVESIDAIWQLSLSCLLMRTIASFLRYTGYLNFINGPISRVLLLILVHVQLLSCLFFWLLVSLQLRTMSLNIAQQFMKEMVKIYFGLLKIQVKFLINWSLEVF